MLVIFVGFVFFRLFLNTNNPRDARGVENSQFCARINTPINELMYSKGHVHRKPWMLRPNWLGVPVVLPLNILVEDRFVQLGKCVRVQWKLDEKN